MTRVVLLRIAAAISALFTLGHTMGGLKKWSPMGGNEVLRQMSAVHFQVMGADRTYLDFYMGFGWALAVAMVLQTVLLWQLSSLASADGAAARPMIVPFIAATAVSGVIAWFFLFPLPALFSLALLVPLIWAYVAAR